MKGLDACLCLQLLPFISVLLGDATNGMVSLLRLIFSTILCTNKIDRLQYSDRDRLTNVESIFTISCEFLRESDHGTVEGQDMVMDCH